MNGEGLIIFIEKDDSIISMDDYVSSHDAFAVVRKETNKIEAIYIKGQLITQHETLDSVIPFAAIAEDGTVNVTLMFNFKYQHYFDSDEFIIKNVDLHSVTAKEVLYKFN